MITGIAINKELGLREAARKSHEYFVRYCWQNTSEDFTVGIHTRELCYQIDRAMDRFERGKSTFLVVKMPFRHGKSAVLSRYLPPHFLGRFPDDEVMLVTYGQSLSEKFSRFARDLVKTNKYKNLYPNISISKENGGVMAWGIARHQGSCLASGLTSGITGSGYHLGLLDDYCASRADAESETQRNSAWEHFTNDFLTRRAPVSITIVLATPWHIDDIIGRIEDSMDPNNERYNPAFPKFKIITFPAKDGEVIVHEREKGKYIKTIKKYDYLFPTRFSLQWYEGQFAALGSYAAAALLQCNPQARGGNLIDVSKIKIHTRVEDFPRTRYYRVWDLAHTAKQTQKTDPDYTSGTLLTYIKINGVWELWIKDVARIRGKAPERDNFIRSVAEKDGNGVQIGVENSIDSRDAISNMQMIFNGTRVVRPINIGIDKVARTGYIEPIFEAGNVHILRGAWNLDWLQEVKAFPSGKHDDQVDNMTAGWFIFSSQGTIRTGIVIGV